MTTDLRVHEEIKKQVRLAEAMERDLQVMYFEKAIKCASNQVVIITKYFKIMAQTYSILENMSENITSPGGIPSNFRKFLETLER